MTIFYLLYLTVIVKLVCICVRQVGSPFLNKRTFDLIWFW